MGREPHARAETVRLAAEGPQTEAICARPPLLSNAGLVLPKCVAANDLLDELLEQVVLPFWLGPDGLGVDCDAGGFANLGLTPDTRGAGESWRLGERFLMPHARTAAAFAKLHASGAFADAKDGGDARDEMPWYYVNGESHPKCLSNGGALALARHAPRFATESMRDEERGGVLLERREKRGAGREVRASRGARSASTRSRCAHGRLRDRPRDREGLRRRGGSRGDGG